MRSCTRRQRGADASEFGSGYRYTQAIDRRVGEVMRERQRLEYLQALGIEVWQSRLLPTNAPGTEPVTEESRGGIPTSPEYQVPAEQKSELAGSPAALDEFGLCLIKYPNCLAVVDLPLTQMNLSDGCQRLLDDVVKVLGVNNGPPALFQEKEGLWEAGAAENLRNRVSQLSGGASSYLLVFGDAACQLLLGNNVKTFTNLEWMGRKTVAGKGLEDLLRNPLLKKALWLSLQQHLSGH